MSSFDYALLVIGKTRLEQLIQRFNTKAQAKFYIEKNGGDFSDYEKEHEVFKESLRIVQTKLSGLIKNKIVERTFLPSFLFGSNQFIVVLGQDGLVANTAKYAGACPIVAINPDPSRFDGILLPFDEINFELAVNQVMSGTFRERYVHFAEARLQDGQKLLAFNELFIGASSHVSARYKITFSGNSEEQSSSGILVSTQAGSTGWLSSVLNMAKAVQGETETNRRNRKFELRENELIFVVREPFKSIRTGIEISVGKLNSKNTLQIESRMPTGGIIFSDGIESDFIQFNSGAIAQIGLAKETARLVQAL